MNTSGVPGQLVKAERQLGFDSRLVTLYRDRRNYGEDICLDLPFIDFLPARWIKKFVSSPEKRTVDNKSRIPATIPVTWKPYSVPERLLVDWRDRYWRAKIERAIAQHQLDRFDVYQLDGGLDLYRNPRFIPEMKKQGKKIICCYTGSDLRTRGVIPDIDELSDLNVSVEYDHLRLHPNIHHVFFPFDANDFSPHDFVEGEPLRIGHAPTNWAAKGSDIIVPILEELALERGIRVIMIQNLPYSEAIRQKQTCDIFVDQIGDLGYGINSLEAMAMGIPVCTCLAPGFETDYTDHPFMVVDAGNLTERLLELLDNPSHLREKGALGRKWVKEYHDAATVVKKIHHLAGIDIG